MGMIPVAYAPRSVVLTFRILRHRQYRLVEKQSHRSPPEKSPRPMYDQVTVVSLPR